MIATLSAVIWMRGSCERRDFPAGNLRTGATPEERAVSHLTIGKTG
jgi:hypothetical protein